MAKCQAFKRLFDVDGSVTIHCDKDEGHDVGSDKTFEESCHEDQFQLLFWNDSTTDVVVKLLGLHPLDSLKEVLAA